MPNSKLINACKIGDLNIVKEEILKGVSLDVGPDSFALYVAGKNGHLNVVKYLIEEKNISLVTGAFSTIMEASRNHHSAVVDYLTEIVKVRRVKVRPQLELRVPCYRRLG